MGTSEKQIHHAAREEEVARQEAGQEGAREEEGAGEEEVARQEEGRRQEEVNRLPHALGCHTCPIKMPECVAITPCSPWGTSGALRNAPGLGPDIGRRAVERLARSGAVGDAGSVSPCCACACGPLRGRRVIINSTAS